MQPIVKEKKDGNRKQSKKKEFKVLDTAEAQFWKRKKWEMAAGWNRKRKAEMPRNYL